jgi:hypothetical protein
MSDLPPLPAGFKIENQPPKLPPLPQGFQLEGPSATSAAPSPPERDEWQRATFLPAAKNLRTGEVAPAVPQFARDLVDAIMLPGDVMKGNVAPGSDEAIGRGFDLVSMIMGGASTKAAGLVDEAGRAVPRSVVRSLKADRIPLNEVGQRVADLGDQAVVADLGMNLRDKAAAIATKPGSAQSTVLDVLAARRAAAPKRVTTALDETLGPAPIPSYLQREIKQGQRAIGPGYDQVLGNAGPIDTSTVAKNIDIAIPGLRGKAQTTLRDVRSMLNETGQPTLDPKATTLFQVRRAIDGILDGETDGNVISALTPVRREVDELLAQHVPGIKGLDAQYRELAKQSEAVDRGQTVLGSDRNSPRPAELADEARAGAVGGDLVSGPSGVTFRLRQGARAEIDRIVGTNLNDRAALNSLLKGNSDWNYQRLNTLLGKEKTDRLYQILENERVMAETENKALSGSKTASLQAAQAEIDGPQRGPGVVRSAMDLKPGTAAAQLVDKIFGGVASRQAAGRNQAIADAIVSRGRWAQPMTTLPIPNAALLQLILRSGGADNQY